MLRNENGDVSFLFQILHECNDAWFWVEQKVKLGKKNGLNKRKAAAIFWQNIGCWDGFVSLILLLI